jgi:hypothetical protein
VAITGAVLGLTVATAQGFGVFFVVPLIVLAVVLLRATWARERIR